MAIGLVIVIAVAGQYLIPPYVLVTPGHPVCVAGIVDHTSIGHGEVLNILNTWYTVSVRLFDDDPVNGIQSGETLAYVVTKADWEMVEWGDTVRIKLLPDIKAEVVELYPSLKLPEWHGGFGGLSIELTANKSAYKIGEKAYFHVKIAYVPEFEYLPPLNLTIFETFPFWAFRDGERVYTSYGGTEFQEIILQPSEEREFDFEWDLTDNNKGALSGGIYYVRVYLGYFTEDEEITLTGTTMIGIEA